MLAKLEYVDAGRLSVRIAVKLNSLMKISQIGIVHIWNDIRGLKIYICLSKTVVDSLVNVTLGILSYNDLNKKSAVQIPTNTNNCTNKIHLTLPFYIPLRQFILPEIQVSKHMPSNQKLVNTSWQLRVHPKRFAAAYKFWLAKSHSLSRCSPWLASCLSLNFKAPKAKVIAPRVPI